MMPSSFFRFFRPLRSIPPFFVGLSSSFILRGLYPFLFVPPGLCAMYPFFFFSLSAPYPFVCLYPFIVQPTLFSCHFTSRILLALAILLLRQVRTFFLNHAPFNSLAYLLALGVLYLCHHPSYHFFPVYLFVQGLAVLIIILYPVSPAHFIEYLFLFIRT
ncbi:hypothetical protein B0H19DRAFT_98886 [Mycena capillaripes]|nr:hypothetical protein B0H19DRAFT_98886 [Mycena capillaripes]